MPQGDEVLHLMVLVVHRKGLRGSIVYVKDNSRAKMEPQGEKTLKLFLPPKGLLGPHSTQGQGLMERNWASQS